MLFSLYKIDGYSMYPSYTPNDYTVCIGPIFFTAKIGDIIVIDHIKFGTIIKRIVKIENDHVWVKGDNPLSTNSNKLGWIPIKNIRGKAILRIKSTSPKNIAI